VRKWCTIGSRSKWWVDEMTAEEDLAALRDLLREDDLERVDEVALAELRREYPNLPEDYFSLLRDLGFGDLRGSRFMLYGGPVSAESVFEAADPICQTRMVLVGDDLAGGHLGYVPTGGAWRLSFFDHLSTDDLELEADNSIVRFLVVHLGDPDD